MLTLVLWQHVVFVCVCRTLFRMSLVMDVRRVLCSVGLTQSLTLRACHSVQRTQFHHTFGRWVLGIWSCIYDDT